MLSILLLILKIIGIILLVILGILLLILIAVLFIPVRYKAVGVYRGDEKWANGQISWAGLLVRIKASYKFGEDFIYSVRICGFRVFFNDDEKTFLRRFLDWREKQARKKKDKKKKGVPDIKEFQQDEKPAEPIPEMKPVEPIQEMKAIETAKPSAGSEQKSVSMNDQPVSEAKEVTRENFNKTVEVPKEKWYNKFRDFIKKLYRRWKAFLGKLTELRGKSQEQKDLIEEKIENLYDQYEVLERFYYKKRSQYAVQKMTRILKKTARYILPTSCKGTLTYGFWDPSITGKSYGICCVLGMVFWKGFLIKPDFNEEILEADMKIKGRIRVVFFVRMALTILLDKKMRMCYKEGKKLYNEVLGGN